jgi:hypothetical protein
MESGTGRTGESAMISGYDALVWVHIILFVYWLGPDWGVYVTAPSIWRKDRTVDERLGSLRTLVRMAQISRNCLILLLPVGLTLAAWLGVSPLEGRWLWLIWALGVAWLGISIVMYRRPGTPLAAQLNSIDAAVRWGLMILLLGVGVVSLLRDTPFDQDWVAVKLLLVGLLLGNSLQQRAIARKWLTGLQALKADAANAGPVEAMFDATARRSQLNAYFTWAASIAIAFFGVTKLNF